MEPKTFITLATDIPNRNGVVFTHDSIEKATSLLQERIAKSGPIYGELNTVDRPDIDLTNVSHKIEEVYLEGNHLMAKISLLNTPQGKVAKDIIEEGLQWDRIGVFPRGNTDPSTITTGPNGERVINDFDIITFDIGPASASALLVQTPAYFNETSD
jgi:hypothetical protein